MRVLWFTNTPCCYECKNKGGYNGGGWLSSLEKEVSKRGDIDLGISFILDDQPFKAKNDNVTYYPLSNKSIRTYYYKHLFTFNKIKREEGSWNLYIKQFQEVIDDFKPDLIQVFGTEYAFGLVYKIAKVPVLLHLQGILNPYFNAFLPPFMGKKDFFNCQEIFRRIIGKDSFSDWECRAHREIEIIKHIDRYLGRTKWDESIVRMYNANCNYFYCSEILRLQFYETDLVRNLPDNLVVVSTISNSFYKGFDVILKTAKLLKSVLHLNFEWHVFGNINPYKIQSLFNLNFKDLNIILRGVADADELIKTEKNSTLYVHPSYIDNSPNSLCEAQLLGVTCIATNVGGVSSLIEDGKTGFLIPSNGPFELASLIKYIYDNPQVNLKIGDTAKVVAIKRHDKTEIVESLIEIYKKSLDSAGENY